MKKLTDEQIIAIHADNRSHEKIAEEYHINRTTIMNIKKGTHRKDLKLGMTAHYRQVQADKILGKRTPRPEPSITAIEILDEENDPMWVRIKNETRERRFYSAADPTP